MKIWKNLKTTEQNLKITKMIEVKMSCVDAKSKGSIKRLVYRNNSVFQRKNGKIQSSVDDDV